MKTLIFLTLLISPLSARTADEAASSTESYKPERALAPAKKVVQVLQASSEALKAFAISRTGMEAELGKGSEFLVRSAVRDFRDLSLLTYGIREKGNFTSRFYLYSSETGALYAYITETSGGAADLAASTSPVKAAIHTTIAELNKAPVKEEELQSLLSSSKRLCEALAKTGDEDNGFSTSGIHVRGWKRGNIITLEFVPADTWETYKTGKPPAKRSSPQLPIISSTALPAPLPTK